MKRVIVMTKGFKELQAKLFDISYINHGGCAFAGIALYDYLIKKGIDAKLIFGYVRPKDNEFIHNKREIRKGGSGIKACDHVFVKVGERFFDCTGEFTKDKWKSNKYKGQLQVTREQAIDSLKCPMWFFQFNRTEYLPILEKIIDYRFW